MRKKATVFRGKQKQPLKSEEAKKQDKVAYMKARYQQKKKEILKQQASYYNDNREMIRNRRRDYWVEYNKRYKRSVDPSTDRRFKH